MKLPDVNFWLALILSKHIHHEAARKWLGSEDSRSSVCFCRATQQAFLRLLTTSAVFTPYGNTPLSNRDAWNLYAELKRDERIGYAEEPAGIEATWKILAMSAASSPKVWMDAYLAAFAVVGEMRLVTLDRGFRNFETQGLDLLLLNP